MTKRDPADSLLTKFVVSMAMSHDSFFAAEEIARERCKSHPELARLIHQRAAVGAQALSTTDPYLYINEFYNALFVGSGPALIGPLCRQGVFRAKVPYESAAGGTGAWVGEALPIPSYKSTTAQLTLDVFKGAIATTFSAELARFGRPSETAILSILRAAVDKWFTQQMLDPSVSATSAHPASMTAGCNSVSSTGSSGAQIAADLASLIGKIASPGSALRWIMRPLTFATVAAKLGSAGMHVSVDDLFGIPCVLLSNSPRQVALIDGAAFVFVSDETADVEVTTQSTIEMSDAPGQSGVSGTGASMVSLYQTGMVAVKVVTSMNWQPIFHNGGSPSVPSGAVYMTTAY